MRLAKACMVPAGCPAVHARTDRRKRPDTHQAPRQADDRRQQQGPRTGSAVQLGDLLQFAHGNQRLQRGKLAGAPDAHRRRERHARNARDRQDRMQGQDPQRTGPGHRQEDHRRRIYQRPHGQRTVRRHEDFGHRRSGPPRILRCHTRQGFDFRRSGDGRRHDRIRRAFGGGRDARGGRRAHDRIPRPHIDRHLQLPGFLPPAERRGIRETQQVQGADGRDQPEPQFLPFAGGNGDFGGDPRKGDIRIRAAA